MTQTTHTPGPWKVYSSAAPNYPATVAFMDGANEMTICDVTETGAQHARLIAAAPDLLAALKSVVEFIADEVEQRGLAGSNMSDYEDEAVQALYRVEAAIAKATGAN